MQQELADEKIDSLTLEVHDILLIVGCRISLFE